MQSFSETELRETNEKVIENIWVHIPANKNLVGSQLRVLKVKNENINPKHSYSNS